MLSSHWKIPAMIEQKMILSLVTPCLTLDVAMSQNGQKIFKVCLIILRQCDVKGFSKLRKTTVLGFSGASSTDIVNKMIRW